ncbi:MAG: tyrosine-type recombinase/integrase [Syntrophomonadaceae bacterium]|nr:tyrosine-type recombinase/integrase [Syntrophomonadaceae bacterium]MDD3024906.1 tyrosine-type recombinase/integrase [Syntrophomonadaceae bacterium]
MTFHHLRHTHATILLSDGQNINEVAERLGHADAGITLKIYGHVLPGRDQILAERFDALIEE